MRDRISKTAERCFAVDLLTSALSSDRDAALLVSHSLLVTKDIISDKSCPATVTAVLANGVRLLYLSSPSGHDDRCGYLVLISPSFCGQGQPHPSSIVITIRTANRFVHSPYLDSSVDVDESTHKALTSSSGNL